MIEINTSDVLFKEGDVVLTTYDMPFKHDASQLYPATVISVIDDTKSTGLGVYYVLHVATHVDDYIDFRAGNRVWASVDEWSKAKKAHEQRASEFAQQIREAKLRLSKRSDK